MDGIMDENQLTNVKVYEFNNPLLTKIDSLIDKSIRDCHHKYFHTFDHVCEYDLNFTNTSNNESVNFTISDKSMGLYELNKKLTLARENGFIFNQINKLTIKIYSNLSHIKIHYHLELGAPPLHRQFFKILSRSRDYIQTHCNDRRNPFHLHVVNGFHIIIHKVIWYNYTNTNTNISINIHIIV